eukprot:EG_transcript_7751
MESRFFSVAKESPYFAAPKQSGADPIHNSSLSVGVLQRSELPTLGDCEKEGLLPAISARNSEVASLSPPRPGASPADDPDGAAGHVPHERPAKRPRGSRQQRSSGSAAGAARRGADADEPVPVSVPGADTVHRVQRALLQWYALHKRDVPWRTTTDPYSVWVSEMMLIQTQVKTVVRHYRRWMDAYPTLQSLAEETDLHRLHDAWGPLGLYKRVELLKRGAEHIMRQHQGVMPREVADLKSIPGVGAYAAGMIAAICYRQREAAVDGNVVRLLCRLFHQPAPPAAYTSRRGTDRIWAVARELVPADHPGEWNQAIMDLGAKVCTPRQPRCGACPLRPLCEAYRVTRDAADPLPGMVGREDRIGGVIPPKLANRYHHRQDLHVAVVLANARWTALTLWAGWTGPLAGTWQFPALPGPVHRRFGAKRCGGSPESPGGPHGGAGEDDASSPPRDVEDCFLQTCDAGEVDNQREVLAPVSGPPTGDDAPSVEDLWHHVEGLLATGLDRRDALVIDCGLAKHAFTHLEWTIHVWCFLLELPEDTLQAVRLSAAAAPPHTRWVEWCALHSGRVDLLR